MPNNSNNDVKNKILGFNESVEKLENVFKTLKEDFDSNRIEKDEFESKKINLLEEIKKTKYKINQLKEKLSVRNEKEKLILEELNLLSEQFQTDIDEDTGIATIYLSASLDFHFQIDVDCSTYPKPPYIFIPKEIDDFFNGKIVTKLKTLKKWSVKNHPHLVDIFKELEVKLVEVFLGDEEIIDNRDKLAKRRKLIELARFAEKEGDFEEVINFYHAILEITQDLKDDDAYLKYKKKLKEVIAHSKQK